MYIENNNNLIKFNTVPNLDSWTELSNNLSQEPALLTGRVSPFRLKELYLDKKAAILYENNQINAFIALWETQVDNWFELGSFWTRPELRGTGLGRKVWDSLMDSAKIDKNLFLITHNPAVIRLANQLNFQELENKNWLKVPFSITCEPCDRIPDEKKLTCPLRAKLDECRLLYHKV